MRPALALPLAPAQGAAAARPRPPAKPAQPWLCVCSPQPPGAVSCGVQPSRASSSCRPLPPSTLPPSPFRLHQHPGATPPSPPPPVVIPPDASVALPCSWRHPAAAQPAASWQQAAAAAPADSCSSRDWQQLVLPPQCSAGLPPLSTAEPTTPPLASPGACGAPPCSSSWAQRGQPAPLPTRGR